MKKSIITTALVLCIVLCSSVRSMACTATSGCYAVTEIAVCGAQHSDYAFAHYVLEPNGYGYYCQVYYVSASHRIICSGCQAFLRTEMRRCAETHSGCGGTKNNLCQY